MASHQSRLFANPSLVMTVSSEVVICLVVVLRLPFMVPVDTKASLLLPHSVHFLNFFDTQPFMNTYRHIIHSTPTYPVGVTQS